MEFWLVGGCSVAIRMYWIALVFDSKLGTWDSCQLTDGRGWFPLSWIFIGLTTLRIRPQPAPTLHTQLTRRPLRHVIHLTTNTRSLGTAGHRKSFATVISAVLLAQTQTRLMGPSDYSRVSFRARVTGQHQLWWWVHTKHKCYLNLDTWYLCLPNISPLSETQQQDGKVLFTRGQHLTEPCQHWGDLTQSWPTLQASHVLVVV